MLLRALTPLFAMGCLSSGEGKPFGSDSGAPVLEDPNPTDDSGEPSDTGSDDAVDPAPSLTVSRMGMVSHLTALMEIAEANGGNRAAGTAGYADSVAYVTAQLEGAGYTVTTSTFDIEQEQWDAPPEVSAEGLGSLTYGEDFYAFGETGAGVVTAPVTAVDLVLPPSGGGEISSGCEAEDFDGFTPGHIALIQRGSCTFQTKTSFAADAGAAAVLIFNTGTPGAMDIYGGTLDPDVENTIPVMALSYDVGATIADLPAGTPVTVALDFRVERVPTQNVFADTGGDHSRTVVVGAHLDSVVAGPGINDNGSGVALILEMALQMAADEISPDNRVRFAFWGGEELGLLGSFDYVLNLPDDEHDTMMANLNFDMVASPNPARMIYDGNGSRFGDAGPSGSGEIEAIFSEWFDAQGLVTQETAFDGRSDYGPFIWTGIPAGGLFTGAEQPKTSAEQDAYGGTAGEAYDACYHQGCDTIENLDLEVLDEMAGAAAHATMGLAFYDGVLGGKSRSILRLPDWLPSSCAAHERTWRR